MSLQQAACFAVALLIFVVLTVRGRVQPFLALVMLAAGFGLAAGMSTSQVARAFGTGFGQSVAALGLVVVAAAMMSEIAADGGAALRLRAWGRSRRGCTLLLGLLGLASGTASTPAAAFAVLDPLRNAIAGPRGALALGFGLSAGHGLLLPAPVVLATLTILDADWGIALRVGIPAAIVAAFAGLVVARFAALAEDETDDPPGPDGNRMNAPRRAVAALVVATVALLALLVAQSLGDIASEPLGGGSNREFLLALGRPLVLMVVGVGLLLLLGGLWQRGGLSETGWAGRAVAKSAGLVLLIGAACGLQKAMQETGMAEMNAERLLDWPLDSGFVLVLPFALAAIVKTLQGSSLVAAITAAGMVEPMLSPLGLSGEGGRTLAALAVGAGAMTVSHVNDGLFWLVARGARLGPGRALARFSLGTLVQGIAALATLEAFLALARAAD